jgi:hypothetical protein
MKDALNGHKAWRDPGKLDRDRRTAGSPLAGTGYVGLSIDDPVWDATVFCKNRDRLLNGDIARKFMTSVLNLPQVRKLLSTADRSLQSGPYADV